MRKEQKRSEHGGPWLNLITSKQIFTIVYIAACLLWIYPLLRIAADYLVKACFFWGILIIASDLFLRRWNYKTPYWYICWTLLLSYLVTILINLDGLYTNTKYFVYNSILLLIVYAQNRNGSVAEHKKMLYWVNNIIIGVALPATAVSLIMFVLRVQFTVEFGVQSYWQGLYMNRLFGVYASPNVGVVLGIISVIAASINSWIVRGKLWRWNAVYIINAGLQMIYYALALSRGGTVTLGVLFFVLAVALVLPRLLRRMKALTAIGLSLVLFVAAFGMVSIMAEGLRMAAEAGVNYFLSLKPGETDSELIDLKRIEELEQDVSNGRVEIWTAGVALWESHPVVGQGNAALSKERSETSALPSGLIRRLEMAKGNMHNVYVQTLVCSGLVGLLLFLVLGALMAGRYLKFLFHRQESNDYPLVAAITAILAALAANGMFETHLLFAGQDPIGIIFWAYAGIGLVMIRKQSTENSRKFAFIGETPYQIMNAINFVINNVEASKGSADLWIYHQFGSASAISQRIKAEGLFVSTYDVEPFKHRLGWRGKVDTLARILWSGRTIKAHLSKRAGQPGEVYDKLMFCSSTALTTVFRAAFPDAQIVLLEDGAGSYFGNIERDYRSGLFNFCNRFFIRGMLDCHPQRLYVNNPVLCTSTVAEEVRALPRLDENNPALNTIETVFDYRDNADYEGKKIIYLTQPLNEVKGFVPGVHEAVLKTLEPYRGETVVRLHPRQKDAATYAFAVDRVSNLWELECTHRIDGEHVLLAAFSTAQLVSKLLCDAEPYLIFAYKLFFTGLDSDHWEDTAALIERFRALYRQPEKIFVPENLEELAAVLDKLADGVQ